MPTNEDLIRDLYRVAEVKDVSGFVKFFTDDGYFYDVSAGQRYYGQDIGKTVEIYARAFPDMHRELYDLYVSGDRVIVELSLNGTHRGPLELPVGTIPATGKEMHTPCCDVFLIQDGKVKSFHCYTAGTIMLGQLGVLGNLGASFAK
jgi:ketosteroid isomerase-like protein